MIQLASLLIGEDPSYTKNFEKSSQRKIKLLASVMMIPVIMWFITGSLTSNIMLGISEDKSILIGLILSVIVFIIERSIIQSRGSRIITVARFTLAISMAVIGAMTLDCILFENDIANKIVQNREQSINSIAETFRAELDVARLTQVEKTNQVYKNWKNAQKNYIHELQGKDGESSGLKGVGPIARQLKQIMNDAKKDYLLEKDNLNKLIVGINSDVENKIQTAKKEFRENGILLRIRSLHELITEDKYALIFYIFLTIVLLIVESLVILFKASCPISIDEQKEKLGDDVIKSNIALYREMLSKRNSLNELRPEVIKAKRLLAKSNSNF